MTLGELLMKCSNVDECTTVYIYDDMESWEQDEPFIRGGVKYALRQCGAKTPVSLFSGEEIVAGYFKRLHVLVRC